ncbi:putative LRR receptor-like serine/threonine-protein kinase isoform X2 [Cinnamomum micranthum f. kanehirae]|uniref:Putative LRR receptor-like serine/threonine-protein kinase isoform X2 n=1 Tax=Cinnamomum micranthum f. kanehirae TaxID=337451 RepID=A0A3S3MKY0_9MAGN|nr:putative LRR receptor-like serine/threonine-protein kinase isoform X2 [Cinnamomum micranthum f. kanehirae]
MRFILLLMERSPASYLWVLFFAFQLWTYGCLGCLDKEKSSLLELKSSINHPNGTSLLSWRVGADCCSWKGVTCSSTTGRVIELDLSRTRDFELGDWYLNVSLLLPLEELRSLKLRDNWLSGFIDEGELAMLRNLEELALGGLNFKGPIPPAIGSLTSLKILDLSSNGHNDSQSIQGLCKLKNLQELDLCCNEFEGMIPLCLSNLTNLQLLDLSYNQFSGKIPASLTAGLSSLLYFSLAYNRFSGLFTLGSFAHLSKLKGLELSNNDLEVETEYPPWNSAFQLKFLGLSNCKLNRWTGTIPSFLYYQYDLTEVDLSHNHLSETFPIWLLENNTRLEILNLRNNSFFGTFNLPLHSNNTNMMLLDISNNHFSEKLPFNIGTLFPNLYLLNISRNFFQGSIPPSLAWKDTFNIVQLDPFEILVSGSNHFMGTIPPSLFNVSLRGLNIGDNQISGTIPSQIGHLSDLNALILNGNHIDGEVPLEFCQLTKLHFLDLAANNLSGPIPSCFNLTNLEYVHLEKNAFSGSIPSALSRSSSLISFNIAYNNIIGAIPSFISRLSELRILLLRRNNLHGHIPVEICRLKNLSLLDLSYNRLSGHLPSCINNLIFGRAVLHNAFHISQTSYLTIPTMNISQRENYAMVYSYSIIDSTVADDITEVEFITKSIVNSYRGGILNYMSGIDLSSNQLTGEIPLEMGQLSGLHSLNLSHNQFTGPVPVTLKNLSQIESLDLSYNRLNGTIPSELTELNYLSVFSVAHNNLSGRVPDMKSQFSTFTESSYEGNPLLCGPPLNKSCISTPPISKAPEEDENKDDDNVVSFYGSLVGSYLVFFIGTIGVLYFTSQRRAMYFL